MDSPFMIRMAERPDYPLICALCLKEGWGSYARGDIEAALDNSIAVVGFSGDRLVAYARALTDGHITVFLCEMLVAEEYRGRGFGRGLLEFLHGLYPATRTDLISIADGFYQGAGFHGVGMGFRKNYG